MCRSEVRVLTCRGSRPRPSLCRVSPRMLPLTTVFPRTRALDPLCSARSRSDHLDRPRPLDRTERGSSPLSGSIDAIPLKPARKGTCRRHLCASRFHPSTFQPPAATDPRACPLLRSAPTPDRARPALRTTRNQTTRVRPRRGRQSLRTRSTGRRIETRGRESPQPVGDRR